MLMLRARPVNHISYRYPRTIQIGQLGTPCSTCPSSCRRFIAHCSYTTTAGSDHFSTTSLRGAGARTSPLWLGTVCGSSFRKYEGDPDKSSQQWRGFDIPQPFLALFLGRFSITSLRLRIALLISKGTSTEGTNQALDTAYTDSDPAWCAAKRATWSCPSLERLNGNPRNACG